MNADDLFESLRRFPSVLSGLTVDLPEAIARRRGPQGAWSIVEIVGHLVDEEQLDFPVRLQLTLTDPTVPWPGIDPEATVLKNDWQHDSVDRLSALFSQKRAENIANILKIENPRWAQVYAHPRGDLSAGDLLAAWAAHDWLHLRQITRRLYEATCDASQPFLTAYAGAWPDRAGG